MIRDIVTSPLMLRMPSEEATADDLQIGQDLLDTLLAHAHECVGMAANMIGVRKRIIAVADGAMTLLMFNPCITEREGAYEAVEECLSLPGRKTPATRHARITVTYRDESFRTRTREFSGMTAQIIQHEVDHCDGIVV
ncbi:MAG: peptide deformylase [Collinsella sp.]|nr:peptide deformylase [Collinsella sp.]